VQIKGKILRGGNGITKKVRQGGGERRKNKKQRKSGGPKTK